MTSRLAAAIDGLDVPVGGDALAEVLGLRDRFEARLCDAVCAFDDIDEWDTAEGCASLAAWLRIRGRMTAGDATKADDDERTPTQRRHDALADIFTHYLDHQTTRTSGHRRPHLNITIGLDTLTNGTGQGSFDDATPITAADARRLACDANLHRVITRADGSILDYGRATRTISTALFTVLCLRDRRCRFPGCDRPCHTTDAHHIRHWIDHGQTKPENLVLLCRWHHGVIHRPGWTIELHPDTTVVVTTPDGRRRTSRPLDAHALTTAA